MRRDIEGERAQFLANARATSEHHELLAIESLQFIDAEPAIGLAFVYGSVARGSATAGSADAVGSDIDLWIELDDLTDSEQSKDRAAQMRARIGKQFGVDLLVHAPGTMLNAVLEQDEFALSVWGDGLLLVDRDAQEVRIPFL